MKKTGNVVVLPLTLCLLGCSGEKNQEKPVESVRVKVMEVNSSEAEVVHRLSLSFVVMGTFNRLHL